MDVKNDLPTPRNLDEAVAHMLIGPMSKLRERSYQVMRDYLAQRFGAVYLQLSDDPKTLAVVQNLFEELTKRPAENSQLKRD